MRSKTKIVVLHMKELIYTGLFILLGVILIVLLIIMFLPKNNTTKQSVSGSSYIPGVYTASLILDNSAVDIEVVLDEASISSIRLASSDEAVTTMYPLIQPVLEDLGTQICKTQDLSAVKYSDDNRCTSKILLETISDTLQKASVNQASGKE